jgi:hypothetical protein
MQAVSAFPARGRFTGHTQADAIIINLAKISSDKKQIDEVYRLS